MKKQATFLALSSTPFRSVLNDQNNKENQHFYQIDFNNSIIEISKLNKQIVDLKANERILNDKIINKDTEIESLKKDKNIRSIISDQPQQKFSLLTNSSTNDTISKENQELKKKIEQI